MWEQQLIETKRGVFEVFTKGAVYLIRNVRMNLQRIYWRMRH